MNRKQKSSKHTVKINVDDIKTYSIADLYDLIAIATGKKDLSKLYYDCTKCNVSKDIQNRLYALAEESGISDSSYSAHWCKVGPKAYDCLPESTVEIEKGFITMKAGT